MPKVNWRIGVNKVNDDAAIMISCGDALGKAARLIAVKDLFVSNFQYKRSKNVRK